MTELLEQDKVASWLLEELALEAEVPEENLMDLIARARSEISRGELFSLEYVAGHGDKPE